MKREEDKRRRREGSGAEKAIIYETASLRSPKG
jgi:hypothetical protein